ncbi:hypothetical protein [Megasphaera sp.]|uniref:hypothetical protein n=1 Tax=Megasphaera sp. TaxID=2023260 RepID=UPI001E167B50|nr:hypothetical protein [Megasphaera sp.]MBS6103300.1 hypothetical protein [Megasphaera sp.]
MYLLISNDYGEEIDSIWYDSEKVSLSSIIDEAKEKYPGRALTVSPISSTSEHVDIVEELTDDEGKRVARERLDSDFKSAQKELLAYLQVAYLNNDADIVESIQEEYKALLMAYKTEKALLDGGV